MNIPLVSVRRRGTVVLLLLVASAFLWSLQAKRAAGLSAAGRSINAAQTSSAPGIPGSWSLIFSDTFPSTTLDTSKWNTCYWWATNGGCTSPGNAELEWYQPYDVFPTVGDLRLEAERRTVNGFNYTSGMITSKDHFSFQYGYMEARMKVPAGQGMWPAFWALPTTEAWPPELDVMEILGNQPNIVHMTVHWPLNGGDAYDGTAWTGPDFSLGYHNFGLDWEPNALTWYVDGVPRKVFTDTTKIPALPMYLLANLAVGGNWPGAPNSSTVFPSYVDIQYIKVWKPAAASGGLDTVGIFRHGTYYLRLLNSTGYADMVVPFGPGTKPYPVVGDWAGQGFDTVGVYDQSNGSFSLRNSNTTGTANERFTLGNPNDVPLGGKWAASATHFGVGVFRPSNGLIYLKNALSTGYADNTMVLGIPGDVGLAGDWNGKGYDGPGVYRPSNSHFYLSNKVCNCSVFADIQFAYGVSGDAPVVGDWVAQGHDGVGLFRQSNGYTYLRTALTTGYADMAFVYGIAGDVPVAGHWQAVYPPAPGNLIALPTALPTGGPGD